jgi:hypothetical protein
MKHKEIKMRTSKIKKSISRKISTAQYESIDIVVEIEEVVEWETTEERMRKTDTVSKILIVDFMKTLEKTMSDLKLNKKISTVSNYGKKNQEKEPQSSIIKEETEDDFDFIS